MLTYFYQLTKVLAFHWLCDSGTLHTAEMVPRTSAIPTPCTPLSKFNRANWNNVDGFYHVRFNIHYVSDLEGSSLVIAPSLPYAGCQDINSRLVEGFSLEAFWLMSAISDYISVVILIISLCWVGVLGKLTPHSPGAVLDTQEHGVKPYFAYYCQQIYGSAVARL